jgi:hypothetical protein
MAGSCEISGPIKYGEFLYQVSDCQLLSTNLHAVAQLKFTCPHTVKYVGPFNGQGARNLS